MKTAIFLGAGASKAEGAPMQNELFQKYFGGGQQWSTEAMKKGLANFFRWMFKIDVTAAPEDLKKVEFPTFEEALGILDLAELRRESLKNFALETAGSENIRLIRQYLVYAMALVIAEELKGSIEQWNAHPAKHPGQGLHQNLVNKLQAQERLQDTIFISTNYDILMDNALLNFPLEEIPGNIDYGVDFTNFDVPENVTQQWRIWRRPTPTATKLYKLHGSLNWLYCPTCNTLTLTPGMKGAIQLIIDEQVSKCRVCQSFMTPIIVPPTFYKDMSKVFLNIIWNKAEIALREVGHIIFCGYSFPDADMHIKYLIKRIETNRNQDLKVTVISNHADKTPEQRKEEEKRFNRFLSCTVKYTEASFEEFANEPQNYY
jgi:hypothetical protein